MKVFHGETEVKVGDTYTITDVGMTRIYRLVEIIGGPKQKVKLFSLNSDREIVAYAGAFDLRFMTEDGESPDEGGEE